MKKIALVGAFLCASGSAFAAPAFYDGFDNPALYGVGTNFVQTINQWKASGAGAYVTNGLGDAGSLAVFMTEASLTNTLSAEGTGKVWTDFKIKPMLGVEMANPPTNGSSFLGYFNSNGYVVAATTIGWHVCTNDVFGGVVAPATNGYARLSLCQDFATSNQAVFLNGQLIIQDLQFVGTAGSYGKLVVQNSDSDCLLDSVWITNGVAPGLGAVATEVQANGYAARTLKVAPGYTQSSFTPYFSTLQAAVNAWRAGDVIQVDQSTDGESLVITRDVSFTGAGISVASLVVASGTAVSFAQSVTCADLSVTGLMTMASGASVTCATANVEGTLAISGNGNVRVTTLNVTGSGLLSFNAGSLSATGADVEMAGTFSISNTWNSGVTLALPFEDNFDAYSHGQKMSKVGFKAWYASDSSVIVSNGYGSGKGVFLASDDWLSNSVSSVTVAGGSTTNIWTDYYIKPALGEAPSSVLDGLSFVAYANTNGFLVVKTLSGWYECSTKLGGGSPTRLSSNDYRRITVCQQVRSANATFAVFVEGDLVAQELAAPADLNKYSSFVADNKDGVAWLDEVKIRYLLPDGLTHDLDGDGVPDAREINLVYNTTHFPMGTVFRIR